MEKNKNLKKTLPETEEEKKDVKVNKDSVPEASQVFQDLESDAEETAETEAEPENKEPMNKPDSSAKEDIQTKGSDSDCNKGDKEDRDDASDPFADFDFEDDYDDFDEEDLSLSGKKEKFNTKIATICVGTIVVLAGTLALLLKKKR